MVPFTLFLVLGSLLKEPTPKKGALIRIWLLGYQGFRVKQITAGLAAVAKQQTQFGKALLEQFDKSNWTELPAIELHMYPKYPRYAKSQWQVLLVPKAPELFGATVHLCQPQPKRCVAKVTFEPLPMRLRRFWGGSDPDDPLRSAPHRLLFVLEIFLLLVLGIASCATALYFVTYASLAIWRGNCENDEGGHSAQLQSRSQIVEQLLHEKLPKSYKLRRHAEVLQDIQHDDMAVDVLDAGQEVLVLEVQRYEGRKRGFLEGLWDSGPATPEVWGRLDDPKGPKGWILLSEDSRGVMGVLGDRAPYRANPKLMVPMFIFVRRQLVLATSHASAQWLLLQSYVGLMPLAILLFIAASLTAMHVRVLTQALSTQKWGICCDQMLEKHRQRLRPDKSNAALHFVVCVVLVVVAMVLGVLGVILAEPSASGSSASGSSASGSSASRSSASGSSASFAWALYFAMLVAVSLHAYDLRASLRALSTWREPALACEFTEYPHEKLPPSNIPFATLTREREPWRQDVTRC